ncbi:kinase-like domain-containing protein, partial [Mycena olivaceomarginata]
QAIGIAEGLAYLHSQGIIHGNLCTVLLISHNEVPVICGYGMLSILGPCTTSVSLFSFPIRYTAPEYFSDESGTSSIRTTAGDIYAFSMVMLEILSGREPFHYLATEHAVFKHLIRGDGPIRTHFDRQAISKRIWDFLTLLWDQTPSSRPVMPNVVAGLIQMCVSWQLSRFC